MVGQLIINILTMCIILRFGFKIQNLFRIELEIWGLFSDTNFTNFSSF